MQVEVKARGKNASRTFCLPWKLESVTALPAVVSSVKSGAGVPMAGTEALMVGK